MGRKEYISIYYSLLRFEWCRQIVKVAAQICTMNHELRIVKDYKVHSYILCTLNKDLDKQKNQGITDILHEQNNQKQTNTYRVREGFIVWSLFISLILFIYFFTIVIIVTTRSWLELNLKS